MTIDRSQKYHFLKQENTRLWSARSRISIQFIFCHWLRSHKRFAHHSTVLNVVKCVCVCVCVCVFVCVLCV